jgi:hypothetical protein
LGLRLIKRREEIMRCIILACAIAGILGVPAFGQGVDPLLGRWKLNVEKSVSSPFRSGTIIIAGEGQNRTLTGEGVTDAKGQPITGGVLQHIYDGQPHPSTGDTNYDASAYARIGNTINVIRFKNGKPVEVGQSILVPGRTYTYTFDIELNGQVNHGVLVYERQ